MNIKQRRKARHARRLSRRDMLKGAITAAFTGLLIPRMVHSETVTIGTHATWDKLLNHVGRQTLGLNTVDRRPELNHWVHGLALRPHEPQPALILTGPQCAGKTTFHEALGLLLPSPSDRLVYSRTSILRPTLAPGETWQSLMDRAWLMVVEDDRPERYQRLFDRHDRKAKHFLKWCVTHSQAVEMPNVKTFEVGLLATTVPRLDLLRRLEDEKVAFRGTLLRAA